MAEFRHLHSKCALFITCITPRPAGRDNGCGGKGLRAEKPLTSYLLPLTSYLTI